MEGGGRAKGGVQEGAGPRGGRGGERWWGRRRRRRGQDTRSRSSRRYVHGALHLNLSFSTPKHPCKIR